MNRTLIAILLCFFGLHIHAQIDFRNYSTSYEGRENLDTVPIVVTAIPYNGVYSNFDDEDVLPALKHEQNFLLSLPSNSRQYYVYDSSDVHFFTPGIFKNNASDYEFRVMLNGKEFIKNWSKIDNFTNTGLNTFRRNFAYLGGYKTTWNNFIVVEIRRKKNHEILSSSVVYWKQVKPELLNVYSSDQLPEVFKKLNNVYFDSTDKEQLEKFKLTYPENEIDPVTHFPKKFIFSSKENNLFFFINAMVYKKEALEYSLIKDDKLITYWRANDVDSRFIWLKDLNYGNYTLNVRLTRQRQSISSFQFQIKPAWQQTILFKIIAGILLIAFVGFIIAIIRLQYQRKLVKKHKKEKTEFELKSIRSQLNPHFIFNALSSIQSLINKNDIENANNYLSDFSNLMRLTLHSSNNEMNVLNKELQLLNNYLQLEQLRFKFQYSITSNVNDNEVEIPSLLLQPIVENAVKHGVSFLQENGEIKILFTKAENDLVIDINDNGKGFDSSKTYSGYGLKLTRERIKIINEKLNDQSISLNVDETNGTTVHLIFKNWLA